MSLHICPTHRMYTPRVNSFVHSGLCIIMICQCRFISSNHCTTLVSDADNGGGCACVRARGYRKCLFLLLSFAVDLKPLSKLKLKKIPERTEM